MAQPWGLLTDKQAIEVFDLFTGGYSVDAICKRTGMGQPVVLGFIRSPMFQADLKLMNDDNQYKEIMSPVRRVAKLQHKALDVMVETMDDPKNKQRVAAAQDVLDRGKDVPRATKVTEAHETVPAEALEFLGLVLGELAAGLSANGFAGQTIDITPAPAEQVTAGQATP